MIAGNGRWEHGSSAKTPTIVNVDAFINRSTWKQSKMEWNLRNAWSSIKFHVIKWKRWGTGQSPIERMLSKTIRTHRNRILGAVNIRASSTQVTGKPDPFMKLNRISASIACIWFASARRRSETHSPHSDSGLAEQVLDSQIPLSAARCQTNR